MGEEPVHRIHEHVLPDKTRHGWHHEKGRDDKNADNSLAPHRLIKQQRQRNAKQNRDDENAADDDQCGGDGGPERTGGDEPDIIVESDPSQVAAAKRQIFLEGKEQGHRQRHQHPAEKKNDSRSHHHSGDRLGMLGGHGDDSLSPAQARMGKGINVAEKAVKIPGAPRDAPGKIVPSGSLRLPSHRWLGPGPWQAPLPPTAGRHRQPRIPG